MYQCYLAYIGVLYIGILFCVWILGQMISRKTRDYQEHMMIAISIIIISLASYIMEITSNSISGKVVAIRMETTANAISNVIFLLYLLRYCQIKVSKRFQYVFFLLHLVGLTLSYSNDFHHLYYTGIQLVQEQGFTSIQLGKGPAYYLYVGFCMIHLPIYMVGCFSKLKYSKGRTRQIYLELIVSGFIPYVAYALYFLGVTGPFDITSLGFLTFAIMVGYITHYRSNNTVELAKDEILNRMDAGVLVTDEAGYLMYANPIALMEFPYLNGKDLLVEKIKLRDFLQLDSVFGGQTDKRVNVRYDDCKIYQNNKVFTCNGVALQDQKVDVGMMYFLYDVTEIERRARRDSMTGLYNHHIFFDILNNVIRKCNETGNTMAVAFIDIDDFKQVNDIYGHSNGDKVLLKLSEIIKENCPKNAYACRYGGEEFAIIFEGDNAFSAKEIMQKILAEISTFKFEFSDQQVTFSCGVKHYEKGLDADEMFKRVDALLYEVKRNGKNHVIEEAVS